MMGYSDDMIRVSTLPLPWERLYGSNILIPGATGLIGSCLVKVLLAKKDADYQVFAGGRDAARARLLFKEFEKDKRFHFFGQDISTPLNSNVDFHFIIHAASDASPSSFISSPVEVMKSNIYGVANLLDYGKEHHLKRFLYISSGEMYGQGDGHVFTEDFSGYVDYASPRSCYPASKRAAEVLSQAYSAEYGLDITIARPCHVYGPDFSEKDNRVYAQFFRNLLKGEDIILKSDGKQRRSWCYVVDCVSALLFILLKGSSGQAYNIADDNSYFSIRELAERIAAMGNRTILVQAPTTAEKKGFNPVSESLFDTAKLRSLGWRIDGDFGSKLWNTFAEMRQIAKVFGENQ